MESRTTRCAMGRRCMDVSRQTSPFMSIFAAGAQNAVEKDIAFTQITSFRCTGIIAHLFPSRKANTGKCHFLLLS